MEEKIELTFLYDFYGELLRPKQREIYESFFFEDLSLGEIASREGTSRQAVHDMVRRCEEKLRDYEAKLRLYERYRTVKEKAELASALTEDKKIQSLLTEIVEAF